VLEIKRLLYEQRFTIEGARNIWTIALAASSARHGEAFASEQQEKAGGFVFHRPHSLLEDPAGTARHADTLK